MCVCKHSILFESNIHVLTGLIWPLRHTPSSPERKKWKPRKIWLVLCVRASERAIMNMNKPIFHFWLQQRPVDSIATDVMDNNNARPKKKLLTRSVIKKNENSVHSRVSSTLQSAVHNFHYKIVRESESTYTTYRVIMGDANVGKCNFSTDWLVALVNEEPKWMPAHNIITPSIDFE